MSLEQITGELDRSGINWTIKDGTLYTSRPERSKIEEASIRLIPKEQGFRLYFISKVECYEKYAEQVKKSVLGRELIEGMNTIIPPSMHIPYHGGFIDSDHTNGLINVFKAFYERQFTPIQGLSQKEEITEKILEDDPDPDTIVAQSL